MSAISSLLPILVVIGFIIGMGLVIWEISTKRNRRRLALWLVLLCVLVAAPLLAIMQQAGMISLPAPVPAASRLLFTGLHDNSLASLDARYPALHTTYALHNTTLTTQRFFVNNQTVYALGDDTRGFPTVQAFALRNTDGTLLWSTPVVDSMNMNFISGENVLVADGLLYILLRDQTFYPQVVALHVDTGKLAWIVQLNNFKNYAYNPPLLTDAGAGRLFISNAATGDFEALRSTDGKIVWHIQTGKMQDYHEKAFVLRGDTIYAFSPDHHGIVALRASDGQALWHMQLENLTLFAVEASTSRLYLSGYQGNGANEKYLLSAFDSKSAGLLWKYNFACPLVPALLEDREKLYMTCGNTLTALKLIDGSRLWTRDGPNPNGGYCQPFIIGNVLFVESISMPMRYMWRSPSFIDALSSEDGSIYWRYTLSNTSGALLTIMS